ncbi:tol-pal system protein YbgF [Rehaibacterium terrae]|uniref:tol-pal system protein YbgF n=1 Tax=Rehaibacterium terrae TaxID=1341696 RepID=UPI00391A11A9
MPPAPVLAQTRTSLADRVARLEQLQAQQGSGQNLELLNQLTDLRAEIQALRGQVEQLQFENEQLRQRNREQYIDLDSRIGRLEQGAVAAASQPPSEAPLPAQEAAVPADAPARPADPVSERAAYEAAFDALKNGQYAESARRFQRFIQDFPDGEYAPNAWYWLGESYYVTQNYDVALESFQSLLQKFPDSNKAPDALLKLGYCQYELRQWAEAEATLNRVIERYPDTTVARLAQGRLRALALERRQ